MRKLLFSDFLYSFLLFAFIALVLPQKTLAAPYVVTLENGFRISFLGVSRDFDRGTSKWNYLVEELPSAQDLSVWMLELLDCHQEKDVVTVTPSSGWYEDPDPNMRLTGIKWEVTDAHESAEFSVTLKGNWEVDTVQVSAKGPRVASGFLAGPSCRVFIPNVVAPIVPVITYLLFDESQTLFINEFMAANDGTPEDPDWIEIHNSGNTEVDMQNLYLTNDLSNPTKYQIPPGVIIPAGGFVVFYAYNDPEQDPDHPNFNLDASGGDIAIFKPDGITEVDHYNYGNQLPDQSEGRCPDGDINWEFFDTPTLGATNGMCE